MSTQVKLPALGENIESGDVLSILVGVGDVVEQDQDLLEIETDKATMPVPCPAAGTIVKILIAEGDTIPVGAPLFEIDAAAAVTSGSSSDVGASGQTPSAALTEPPVAATQRASVSAPRSEPPAIETAPPTVESAPASTSIPAVASMAKKKAKTATPAPDVDQPGDGRSSAAAGPAVRRLARELGVELRRVRPAAGSGRITETDVRDYVRNSQAAAESRAPKGVTPPGAPDSDGQGAVRREKMSRMRKTIARNMALSYTTIPQLTNFDDVDVTELEHMRKESKGDYAAQGIKLTAMPFLIKSIASALKRHPIVNASVSESGDEIIYKEYVNVGVAVDTERGLAVPVLRDADQKNIPQIARELAQLAESVRTGDFSVDDLRGGTFTVSNLGAVGGTYSTPIINPPEAAILLVGRSRVLPQYIDGQLEPRMIMPLSITYDHRIVDGAAAARFLNDVKAFLSNPGRLLLAP